jgi:hypothetical protein
MAQLKLCPFKTAPGRVFQQPEAMAFANRFVRRLLR